MATTIPLLRRDHVNFTLVLGALERQVELAEAGREASTDLVKLILKYFKGYPRKIHHPKEDLIYGALFQHMSGRASNLFHVIQDHRDLSACLDTLEQTTAELKTDDFESVDKFCQAARRFIKKEFEHISLEEGNLYPDAVHLLTDEEWARIDGVTADDTDPLFGAVVAGPFEELKDAILLLDKRLTPHQ